MNTSKFYDQWATTYDTDRNRTRDLDEKVLREVLGTMRVSAILELGCGTGKNTLFLSEIGEDIEAYDFSANMIERAKEKVSAKNVRFLQADITSRWTREEQSVDLIVCNLVLEHVEDLSTVFQEVHRVLRDGGLFFLSELHPFRQYQGAKPNFSRERSETTLDGGSRAPSGVETEAFVSETFVHHISDFIKSARACGLAVEELNEWWHEGDEGEPPRLITFLFRKELINHSGTSAMSR
jgi:Methylase involved in ubiquinone/menaquinone biosynthesis